MEVLDIEKIEQLETTTSYAEVRKIIFGLQSEELRVQQIYRLHDWDKNSLIMEFESEKSKIQALEYIADEITRYKVILTLSDEAKLEQINNEKLKKPELIGLVQMSIAKKERLKEIFLPFKRKYLKIGLNPKETIGIEVETEGRSSNSIQKFKYVMNEDEKNGWECKRDETFEENEGVEIASRVLKDDETSVEEIYMVCSMLEKAGQKSTEKCAGQIHIGAHNLTSKAAYVNLLEIYGNCERILYLMSNGKGELPRQGIKEWERTLSPKLNDAIAQGKIKLDDEESLEQFIDQIQKMQGERLYGINLLNVNNDKNTIEFRLPNGTIDPEIWIENARLFGRIVELSQKLAEVEKNENLDEADKKAVEIKQKLKQEISEREKMELLLELLFTEEERQVYRDRYLCNEMLLEELEQKSPEKSPFKGVEFKSVDFRRHTIGEFEQVVRSATKSEVVGIMKETILGETKEERETSKGAD